MNNRFKVIIAKSSIILSGFFLAFTALGFPILGACLGYEFEEIEKIWIILWVLTFISGAIMVFLISSVNFLEENTPEKIHLSFKNYESLKKFLDQTLKKHGFKVCLTQIISASQEIHVYINSPKQWVTDCFSIIRVSELSQENLSIANEQITEILKSYRNQIIKRNTVNMTSVFCVDRITPTFRKMLKCNMQQGLKNGRLIVGISFGGKNIYIAQQRDGFAIARYRKLRNFFIGIMCMGQRDGSAVSSQENEISPN